VLCEKPKSVIKENEELGVLYGTRNYYNFKKITLYPATLAEKVRFSKNFAVVT